MADRELSKEQLIERSINKKYRKQIWNPFIEAVKKYRLIADGDSIAVCMSGGKDSALLAMLMKILQKHSDIPFSLRYIVMNPGYSTANMQKINANAEILNIPVHIFKTDIFAVAQKQRLTPCYLCARMRRGHLYDEARRLGCNKIALGHHFSDVIETTVLGMMYGSQLQGMLPKLHSVNFEGMELIRPMYCVHEDAVKAWAAYNGLEFLNCACKVSERDSGEGAPGSKRQEIKQLIRELKKSNPGVERSIFNALHNVKLDTLCEYTSGGENHSFLDVY